MKTPNGGFLVVSLWWLVMERITYELPPNRDSLTLGLPMTVLVGRVTVSVRIVAGGATEEVALEQDDGEVRETEEGPLETEGDAEAPLWLEGERGRPEDLAVSTWRGDLAVRTRRGSATTPLDVDGFVSPSFDLPMKDFSFP